MVVIITVSVPLSTRILWGSAKNEIPGVKQLQNQKIKIKGEKSLNKLYYSYYNNIVACHIVSLNLRCGVLHFWNMGE